ncbi:hypothetical protein RSSE_c3058 [Ralstonia solanacearum]|nr:hypothetical protein RSSE_c3058 [Ralstonia solanacearum]
MGQVYFGGWVSFTSALTLKSLPNEKRPGRACNRVVKSRPSRYSVRYIKRDLN